MWFLLAALLPAHADTSEEASPPPEDAATVPPRYPLAVSYALGVTGSGEGAAPHGGLRVVVPVYAGFAVDLGSRHAEIADLSIGGLGFGIRYTAPFGAHLRLGGAHNHETPLDVAEAKPFWVATGTLDETTHRSGVEVAAGYTLRLPWGRASRWGWTTEASLTRFLDDGGPMTYALLETGLALHVGRARAR